MRVGVLALQGDYEAHAKALERAGAEPVEVRTAAELDSVRGLVIPGGESTTMLKLMSYYELFEPLKAFAAERPVFGTCAGAILIASEVLNPPQASLHLVDLTIERNGYGRQLDSRVVSVAQHGLGGDPELEVILIRAPIIRSTGGQVLASYLDSPILVDYGRHMVATFHPELTEDPRVHALFLSKIN
ncbi:MAG: pyridoxal 5'-phosphate synthase glutaminase subunit PdxT [Bryobacteraceae bacterium]|nr:pyridoxal 5'-phosphate synthase glutaminase subunit PdxT [Bryobacteraceae bacterium]